MNIKPEKAYNKIIALIPAAGTTRDVFGRYSSFPSALVKIAGSPIIIRIIESLEEKGIGEFRIGILSENREDFEYCLQRFKGRVNINLFEIDLTESPVSTIQQLSRNLPYSHSVLINLGDTFCEFALDELTHTPVSLLVAEVDDTERWATLDMDIDGRVLRLMEKNTNSKSKIGICGVYWFENSVVFNRKISALGNKDFISTLLSSYYDQDLFAVHSKNWFDSDHDDQSENSNKKLIESRSFNSLEIDRFRGIITKRTSNWEKLDREIQYYERIPKELQVFYPRMIQFSRSIHNQYQELEFYSYESLSGNFVYNCPRPYIWRQIFAKLRQISLIEFSRHESVIQNNGLEGIFIDRLKTRFESILESKNILSELVTEDLITINGKVYSGVNQILADAKVIFSTLKSPVTFIHGDFCLSNILCDLDTLNIRLIDPRGGFETPSNYGFQLYDMAKLGHSIIGGYDFIIHGQFKLEISSVSKSTFDFDIFTTHTHKEIENLFYEVYIDGSIDRNLLDLSIGLVMLGIPSFHFSNPNHALALFLRGIQMSNDALEIINENLH
jgi:dTDP-glucose pyrophosphorylase